MGKILEARRNKIHHTRSQNNQHNSRNKQKNGKHKQKLTTGRVNYIWEDH